MNNTTEFNFGKITLLDRIVVSVVNTGILMDAEKVETLLSYCSKYYNNKPFALLSKRTNSYSIDPMSYFHTENFNLEAYAVFTNSRIALANAQIESQFIARPFKVFTDEELAMCWLRDMLNTKKNKTAL